MANKKNDEKGTSKKISGRKKNKEKIFSLYSVKKKNLAKFNCGFTIKYQTM